MIESPAEAIDFEPLATEDPDSAIKDPEQPRTLQPITSSFRKSIQLLHAVGGFAGRFRGFGVYFSTAILVQWVAGMVSFFVPRSLANIVAVVALAQLSMAWTHIVISEPSPKPWYRRIPEAKTWKKVAGPTALLAVTEQIAVFVPLYIAMACGLTENPAYLTPHQKSMVGVQGLFLVLLGFVLAILLVIPANVVLTRVQASLLSDSEETIVPFDRSFGGKFVPGIVGGDGISLLDAWKTFTMENRIRLLKAYAKVAAMQFALWILFTIVLVVQLFMIVGKDFSKLVPEEPSKI